MYEWMYTKNEYLCFVDLLSKVVLMLFSCHIILNNENDFFREILINQWQKLEQQIKKAKKC